MSWQPIETAPTDGSHVQLWRNDIQFTGYFSGFRGGSWIINAPGLPVVDPPPTAWRNLFPSPIVEVRAERERKAREFSASWDRENRLAGVGA